MSDLLNNKFLSVPGVYNPFSALLAGRKGFKAVYLSGGGLTASMGLPDLGVITLTELAGMVRSIHEITDIPIIVDADTGFGETLSVYRTVKLLEEAGASAIQIEDQVSPKRCGHLNGKEVVSKDNMVEKIRAASAARKDSLIIARTDARAVTGMDDALERAKTYVKEGADIVFPEALTDREEFRYFAENTDFPLLANMTEFGKTPFIKASEFQEMGYRFVIFPVTLFRIAAKAMDDALEALKVQGTQEGIINNMMTRKEQYEVINYDFYQDFDKNIARRKLKN
ncbi:MAG: methylisocitrate lyase [Candidatus Thermoplasmatota archaeon]|uniref:methylisocitrate lyase n=1 Tax=Ferroplasma sp. TaxID=2591003 RepID=UPI002619BEDA|nr:methylisocitrate lyase [Ferroplasma sp.]MCL4312015.1 methylisocitrate lyase [Candidatus Thermoplasmatota archaeon]